MSSKKHVSSSITTSQMSTASHLPSLSLPKKIHSISNMQSKITSSIPPPPPLLRIPNYQTKPNYTQTSNRIPTQQSSPQPSLDISQYPIQTNETPNLTSHLINLLKAPSSVPVQSSKTNLSEMSDNETQNSFLPLTLPNDDPGPCHSKSMLDDSVYSKNNPAELSSTCCVASLPNGDKFEGPRSVSDDSEFSIGDLSELSNAQKCKQYREKNKEKRRQDERNYEKALQRNIELKRISQEKKETIRKLKEYYYKCLREEKIKNKKCKKKEKGREKVDNLEKKETEKNEERGDTEDDLESKEKFDENKERGDNEDEGYKEKNDKDNSVANDTKHMVIIKEEIDLKIDIIDDQFSEKT